MSMLLDQRSRMTTIELTVVVPCFNEVDNVEPLTRLLEIALAGIAWEIIYVDDDSPHGTAAKVRDLSQPNTRVRCIQRIGRPGLSTAVIEGMLASSAPTSRSSMPISSMTRNCCLECSSR
jgi:dolichol-phosphate mannosyltransferase